MTSFCSKSIFKVPLVLGIFFKYWFLLHCFHMPVRGIFGSSHFRKKEIKGSRWCNSGFIHLQEILGRLPLNLHRRDKHFFEPCCNAVSLSPISVFSICPKVSSENGIGIYVSFQKMNKVNL